VSWINYQIALACFHAYSTDYRYDAAGNMTFDATASLSYTFDQENRLTGAAGYTYTYDADGNRVRKSNGNLAANGTLYWYMTPAWWQKAIWPAPPRANTSSLTASAWPAATAQPGRAAYFITSLII
jgi:hypothetical protein